LRSTPAIALAVLLASTLACLPAQAVELIDLNDLHAGGPRATLVHGHARTQLPAYVPAYLADSLSGYRIDHRTGDWGEDDPTGLSAEIFPGVPLPSESAPATAMLEAAPVALPVPEPVSVLMLACGLLLIMPGAWVARWSRLGDNESLLQRRLP